MKNSNVKINKHILLFVAFFFLIVIIKLVYINYSEEVNGLNLKEFAKNRRTVNKILPSQRGSILDVNGEALAKNGNSYTVIAYLHDGRTTDKNKPMHVVDKEMTAKKLSPIINMTEKRIMSILSSEDVYQVELGPGGRGISELTKEEIQSLKLPGIDFVKSTKRDYPYGDFASYIVGYSKKDHTDHLVGELGIELMYDDILNGTDGRTEYEKDAYGYKLANSDSYTIDPIDGNDVYLTIDSNIQLHVENAMLALRKINMDWATLTVADAKTGAIVGNSAYPSFNPNILEIENYNNPLTSFTYEPGSTMKIFSYMAALDHGKYDTNAKVNTGYMEVDGFKISDWWKDGWGMIDYDTGFAYSSNLVAARLGREVGKNNLIDYYKNLGFSQKTGIELGTEQSGVVNFKYETELINASFGQGITTTPIQNIKAMTALTNDGVVLKPYIIDKIKDGDKTIYEGKRTEVKKVSSPKTVNKVMDLMDDVVNGTRAFDTGKVYKSDKIRIIGKTGTAQYSDGSGEYKRGDFYNIKSFSGIFPKEDPQYIIYVSVKDFIGDSRNIADAIVPLVESIAKYKNILKEENISKNQIVTVDNYINKNTKEVKSPCLNQIILGNGTKIIDQFPKANTKVICNSKLFLKTNSDKYLMPDVSNFNVSEIITLANMFNLKYNVVGYGGDVKVSIKTGEDILKKGKLTINLGENNEEINEKIAEN